MGAPYIYDISRLRVKKKYVSSSASSAKLRTYRCSILALSNIALIIKIDIVYVCVITTAILVTPKFYYQRNWRIGAVTFCSLPSNNKKVKTV